MQPYGNLISEHGKSKFYISIFVIPAVAFAGAGIFLLSLIPAIHAHKINFHGDTSILYGAGFGGILIAAAALLAGYLLLRSQPTFYLYEKAIRVVGKNIDRIDLYEDIEDLFIYDHSRVLQFCYRSSSHTPWIFADGRTHRYSFLKDEFLDLHTAHRGEKLFQAIQEGKTAIFHCLPDQVSWSKSWIVSSRNMDYPMYDIELNRNDLRIQDKTIPVKRIGDVKTNSWIERSQIVDVDGNVFHKTHSTAIISFNVLQKLLARIQKENQNASR